MKNWSMLIITANLDVITHAAMVPIFALLTARIARKLDGVFKYFVPRAVKNPFERKDSFAALAFKKCPKCAEQLPLSTLVCDACDYNFLAGSVIRPHTALPAPDEFRLTKHRDKRLPITHSFSSESSELFTTT
jgi:hypothetical protein